MPRQDDMKPAPAPAHRPAAQRARGFSLVELVIVMSIVAIAAAIAIPRYSASVVRYRLDAAARRVVADLDRARTAARVTSSTRAVAFDAAAVRYSVAGESSLRRATLPYTVELTEEPYRAHALAASFGTLTTLTFNAFGLPQSGGEVTIRIGSHERKVVVNTATGKADIH